MSMPPPAITRTSSLVSTVSGTSEFTHSVDDFDEDNVVSLGDYFYGRSSKAVIRKGKKRSRDHDDVSGLVTNQLVWTQQSSDP